MPVISALMSRLTRGTAGLGVWKEIHTGQDPQSVPPSIISSEALNHPFFGLCDLIYKNRWVLLSVRTFLDAENGDPN